MPFDFATYLRTYAPSQLYSIQPLTGGIVNEVVRAGTVDPPERQSDKARHSQHSSLVLKYAAPFIAAVGPEAPFDVFRQTIEARALSLFAPGSSFQLNEICTRSTVIVPELVHHDDKSNVLIISDLGQLENLSEHFRAFLKTTEKDGAENNKGRSPIGVRMDDESQVETSHHDDYYRSIGSRLGHFFALLHSPQSLKQLQTCPEYSASFLDNPGMKNVVFSEAIEPIKEHLLKFPDLVDGCEANELYQRISDNFWRATPPQQKSICLGDCWTASIMIEPPANLETSEGSQSSRNDREENMDNSSFDLPKLGVIDWEFASIGRGLDGDVAQLFAHLQQFCMYARHRGNKTLERAVRTSISGFIHSYREHSVKERAPWTELPQPTGPGEGRAISQGQASIYRSFFLAFAAEMINCAFWKDWDCGYGCCRSTSAVGDDDLMELLLEPGGGNESPSTGSSRGRAESDSSRGEPPNFKKENCRLVRGFMELAIAYLRCAGRDEEDFMREENLNAILAQPFGLAEEVFLPPIQPTRWQDKATSSMDQRGVEAQG